MRILSGEWKRRVVAAGVVVASVALFALEWTRAPRVHATPRVKRELASARGELYLGTVFEGLPLRTVDPFLYSDCIPGQKRVAPVPCAWLKVDGGRVSGGDARQVARARSRLRRIA